MYIIIVVILILILIFFLTRTEWQRLSQSSANSSHFVDGSDPAFQDGVRFEHLYHHNPHDDHLFLSQDGVKESIAMIVIRDLDWSP